MLDHCIGLSSSVPAAGPPATSRRGGSSAGSPTSCCSSGASSTTTRLMHRDFEPYYVRVGDYWTRSTTPRRPSDWMKPLVRGEETNLVEIPANWYLDDLPPMMFIKSSPNCHGFVNPRHLEEMWRDQFDWVYREQDYAVFTMTIHPDVSGRPQVLLMLERLIEHINCTRACAGRRSTRSPTTSPSARPGRPDHGRRCSPRRRHALRRRSCVVRAAAAWSVPPGRSRWREGRRHTSPAC